MRVNVGPRLLLVTALAALPALALATSDVEPATTTALQASTHPMRFHLALPSGWKADRTWPVLVVIPDAGREFAANLASFVKARGSRPYILVAPEVLSCGGAGSRTADHYSYTPAEWDSLQHGDDFAFEDGGLEAVLTDVHRRWHGETQAFLTGWEAGGHTVWAQALRHPERWRGVAPVTTNYQRRGLDSTLFSRAPERASLAIQPFRCGAPTGDMSRAMAGLEQQTALAMNDARDHGFHPLPVRVVPGADHGPLPGAVLAWCDSLRQRG
jgi:dienelactone hydrolase